LVKNVADCRAFWVSVAVPWFAAGGAQRLMGAHIAAIRDRFVTSLAIAFSITEHTLKKISFRPSAILLVLSFAGLAPSAHAVNFAFRDVSQNGSMTAEQLGAFQAAANFWSGKLTDNVTVYIDIAFNDLGPNILGGTSSNFGTAAYSSIRNRLTLDATSALDATAVANLQAGPALTFLATQGDLSTRFDNDGSVNNTLLGLTTANAKAMGYAVGTNVANPDASIEFATGFAGDFVYTRVNGVPANKIDFCAGPANGCGLPNTPDRFEGDWWYEPLDLFRYSAPGAMDVRVGGSPYFSVDGGVTSIEKFSTGAFNGDGWQASHFGPGALNLMRAFVHNGEFYDATARDLAAFDAIGWDVAAVPEPETYAMMLLGLGAVGWASRRRARAAV
jgi:hypothetical protein